MIDQLVALDASLLLRLNDLGRPDWVTAIMRLASFVGRIGALWLVLGIVGRVAGRVDWSGFWRLLLALLFTTALVNGGLKPGFARARPFVTHPSVELLDTPPVSLSFPSGHAATAAAGAFALGRIWPGATVPLWLLAALIAASRIYLGAHYPTDVVAGLLAGVACAYFVTGGKKYEGLGARDYI